MTEYAPEEAARRTGSDCGPQIEDSSYSGMGVGRMFSRGGALEDFSKIFLGGKKRLNLFFTSKAYLNPGNILESFLMKL